MCWAGRNLKEAHSLRLVPVYFGAGLSANVLPAMVTIQSKDISAAAVESGGSTPRSGLLRIGGEAFLEPTGAVALVSWHDEGALPVAVFGLQLPDREWIEWVLA